MEGEVEVIVSRGGGNVRFVGEPWLRIDVLKSAISTAGSYL